MDTKSALLDWYDAQRRDLPWRRTADPYAVWLSEIMLQQTQVQTVIPYYESFLERFPTVEHLATAPLSEVLALWSGLGYYRRARQLHRAAVQVIERGEGFPTDAEGLLELPGVGPYTAAAVASIAFGEAVPVLDGNVERVLCRLLAETGNPKRQPVRRRLLAAAGELLDSDRPGDSNQALMELGATLCRPRQPACGSCPLQGRCEASQRGEPERFPSPRPRRARERLELAVALVEERGRVLLFRRPDGSDLLAGLWELPMVPQEGGLRRVETALATRYGGGWRLEPSRFRVRHGITYRDLILHVHPARLAADEVAEGPEAAWVAASERRRYAVSSMVEKVLERAGAPGSQEGSGASRE